jgi:hypothetical protein
MQEPNCTTTLSRVVAWFGKDSDQGIASEVAEELRFKQDREGHDFNRAAHGQQF